MNNHNFSVMWEKNPIVQWFRLQRFKKGTYLLDEKKLSEELGINPISVNHGLNYLWSTGELLVDRGDKKGRWYVGEEKVKYVEGEGWYLNKKLIWKVS